LAAVGLTRQHADPRLSKTNLPDRRAIRDGLRLVTTSPA
jgi:hypothetical protein